MRRLFLSILILCHLTLAGSAVRADEQKTVDESVRKDGATPDLSFQLPTLDGQLVSIDKAPDVKATVVCFLGAECPMVKIYSPRLIAFANQFSAQSVRFVAVNSNRQDTLDDIRGYLNQHPLPFPYVRDEGNVVADQFGATRTPEVFVLNSELQIVYHGRIDDQYEPGINRPAATHNDLRNAIEQTLAGQPLAVTKTPPVGCMIGKIRRPVTPSPEATVQVTYCDQVARVLQKHCVECHRAGEIGPFALDSYEEAVGWADTSLEVIDNGRMPPWHASSEHGTFANARDMPAADKEIIRQWIAAGMPKGDESKMPEPANFASLWADGQKPDLEIAMRAEPYRIPAEGTVEYQYFVIDPGFTEEKWVQAAQVIPGNRSVVHHAIVFIRPPDDQPFRGVGWLTAYVPGQRMIPMPPGHARRVPAGSRLVFQMHYTTNGTEQEDLSKVGVIFADPTEVTEEVITLIGIDQEFEIPPQAEHHEVKGRVRWMPKDGKLLAIAPHMHVRGKSFEMSAEKPDGSTTLLNVPQYDFNWQHSYVLSEPVPLSEITNLNFTATFDNSEKNPFNPDPTQWVNWGDQTWEEMAVVFLEVSDPLKKSEEKTGDNLQARLNRRQAGNDSTPVEDVLSEADRRSRIEEQVQNFVNDFFDRLDTNHDGVLMRSEAPVALRTRFDQYDHNNDQAADRSELEAIARRRFDR
jgi:mono/diheme cytochrome c family protein